MKSYISMVAIAFVLMFAAAPAWGQQAIPNALLRVTVRQKENGKIDQGLHIQELACFGGECSLTTVSLNQCGEAGLTGNVAFAASAERHTTQSGSLKVTNEDDTLVTVETGSDIGGDYVTTQRFRYEKPRQGDSINRLIGYSGGYVKNSLILQKVVTTEFVPLYGAFQRLKLDCDVLLPGVDSSQ